LAALAVGDAPADVPEADRAAPVTPREAHRAPQARYALGALDLRPAQLLVRPREHQLGSQLGRLQLLHQRAEEGLQLLGEHPGATLVQTGVAVVLRQHAGEPLGRLLREAGDLAIHRTLIGHWPPPCLSGKTPPFPILLGNVSYSFE